MPLLLTQSEAADELGTDREHIRVLVRSGEIEVVAYRSREMIPKEELVRWVREKKRRSMHWQSEAVASKTDFVASTAKVDRASARRWRRS